MKSLLWSVLCSMSLVAMQGREVSVGGFGYGIAAVALMRQRAAAPQAPAKPIGHTSALRQASTGGAAAPAVVRWAAQSVGYARPMQTPTSAQASSRQTAPAVVASSASIHSASPHILAQSPEHVVRELRQRSISQPVPNHAVIVHRTHAQARIVCCKTELELLSLADVLDAVQDLTVKEIMLFPQTWELIARMPHIRRLDVSASNIPVEVLVRILSCCKELELLDISKCQTVSMADWEEFTAALGGAKKLKTLIIRGLPINDAVLDAITSRCLQVERLDFFSAIALPVTAEGLQKLSRLKKLKSFECSGISFPIGVFYELLPQLSDLEELSIHFATLAYRAWAFVIGCPALKKLYVPHSNIDDTILKQLGTTRKSIVALDLSFCVRLTPVGWAALAEMSGLRELMVESSSIDGASLGMVMRACKDLRCLRIAGCSEISLPMGTRSFKMSKLSCCPVSVAEYAVITALLTHSPMLEELDILGGADATEPFVWPDGLRLLLLKRVNICRSGFDDAALATLVANCHDLEYVDLSNSTKITPITVDQSDPRRKRPSGFAVLSGLNRLKYLSLSGTRIDLETVMQLLDGLPRLEVLDITHCDFGNFTSAVVIAALRHKTLKRILIDEGSVPAGVVEDLRSPQRAEICCVERSVVAGGGAQATPAPAAIPASVVEQVAAVVP